MHPLGQTWVDNHPDLIEGGSVTRAQCQGCHGATYRGTVLSRVQATTRSVTSKFGTKNFWRGQQIGCFDCHNGANSSDPATNTAPVVANVATNTSNAAMVAMALPGSDANGNPLTFRVVSQPAHGSVGVSNNVATYFPEPGFVGSDTLTFAANDGYVDSNLGTGTVSVAQGPFSIGAIAHVPPSYPADWPVAFSVVPAVTNQAASVTFAWDFGDGSALSTNQNAGHSYMLPGNYLWTVVSSVAGASATNSGSITIGDPVLLGVAKGGGVLTVAWPQTLADAVLEQSLVLSGLSSWHATTNAVNSGNSLFSVSLADPSGNAFFRLRQVQ